MINNLLNSINKQFLRLAKPFTNKYYNNLVNKLRKEKPNNDSVLLDDLIPDQRHLAENDIEKIRTIAIRILNCLDHLGQKLKFDYFLAYGTLIGAVRHQGFIPWDDDLDIMMTYKDFGKLLDHSHLLPPSLILFRMDKDFWKLMDRYSIISKDGKRGIAVDIFLLSDKKKDRLSFRNVHTRKIESFPTSDFFPTTTKPFEGQHEFQLPNNVHDILTRIYGDYMKLPPKEQRVFPHLNDDLIINNFGHEL